MAPTRLRCVATALVALAASAACSSTPAPAPAATGSVPPSAPATRDTTAACAALPPFDAAVVTYPGADPEGPQPTADALKQWAGTAIGPVGTLAGSVPAELDPTVATLRAAIDSAAQGTPVNPEDPAVTEAATALDKWGYDSCGFPRLDVSGTGTALTGVPATLSPGPLAIRFDNGGAPDRHGFVLLLAKVRDGASYTLDGIRDGSVDFTSVADVVGAAQPTPDQTGYFIATIAPGRYLVVSPIGTPPRFTGTVATEVEAR